MSIVFCVLAHGGMVMSHRALAAGMVILSANFIINPAYASPGCPGDVTNNHVTDANDLLSVINNWGPCAGCGADITGNGVVDTDDLLSVVNGWGACPCLPQYGCASGTRLWCENFELGTYARWTGGYYNWSSCATSGFAGTEFTSPNHSERSEIHC